MEIQTMDLVMVIPTMVLVMVIPTLELMLKSEMSKFQGKNVNMEGKNASKFHVKIVDMLAFQETCLNKNVVMLRFQKYPEFLMKDVLMLRFQTATKFQRKSVTQPVTNQEEDMVAAIVPALMDQAM